LTKRIPWTREEFILVLDLYFRTDRGQKLSQKDKMITVVSQQLQQMNPAGLLENPKFRNFNGIKMRLMNYRAVDRQHKTKGLDNRNRAVRAIFHEFENNLLLLSEEAQKIRRKYGLELPENEKLFPADYPLGIETTNLSGQKVMEAAEPFSTFSHQSASRQEKPTTIAARIDENFQMLQRISRQVEMEYTHFGHNNPPETLANTRPISEPEWQQMLQAAFLLNQQAQSLTRDSELFNKQISLLRKILVKFEQWTGARLTNIAYRGSLWLSFVEAQAILQRLLELSNRLNAQIA